MIAVRPIAIAGALFVCVGLSGCAKASPDTTGYSKVNSEVFSAGFDATWQHVKTVLREQEYLIYTRDKRGYFLAYTNISSRWFVPQRTELEITVVPVTSESTRVTVETSFQQYGVTLLTYPGWLERPTEDDATALAVLAGIQNKVAGGPSGTEGTSAD